MPAISKEKSRIKLIVYIPQNNGEDIPRTYYNFVKNNKQSDYKIMADMERRLLNGLLSGNFRTAIFYDTKSRQELKQINGSASSSNYQFDKQKSKIKLVVYVPDFSNINGGKDIIYNRYSPLRMNKKAPFEIIDFMETTFLKGLYKGKFRTALFYMNENQGRNSKPISKIFGGFYPENEPNFNPEI